jgi:hypothetical protein
VYFQVQKSMGVYLSAGMQGMGKLMEMVVQDTYFFNTELDHHLPVLQCVSFE